MKAKLTDAPVQRPGLGLRAQARRDPGDRAPRRPSGATLTSRTGTDLTLRLPGAGRGAEAEPAPEFVADGEIVAFEGSRTSFERLQGRMGIADPRLARLTGIAVFLYLFDLLELDGHDLTGLPLRERKALLRRALSFEGPLRYTPHRNEHGEEFFLEACTQGLGGADRQARRQPLRPRPQPATG